MPDFTHMLRSSAALLILALSLPCSSPAAAPGEGPMAVVRESNEAVLEVYRSTEKADAEAEARILAIVDDVTNYEALAEAATERSCNHLETGECETFREVFIELLRISAVKKLGRYRADRFDYLAEEVTEEGAVVETAAFFGEDEVSLVYHLRQSENGWRIVNYVVDDIDTIRNYRKQFKRLFEQEDLEAVLKRLRDRIAKFEAEELS